MADSGARETSDYGLWPCPECGGKEYYTYRGESCFSCTHAHNRFASGPLAIFIEAGGEDSPHPDRIKDGTHIYNIGLPPIETVVGRKPNGKLITESRPVTNNELANSRGAREYALRAGLEPLGSGKRYRAV